MKKPDLSDLRIRGDKYYHDVRPKPRIRINVRIWRALWDRTEQPNETTRAATREDSQ